MITPYEIARLRELKRLTKETSSSSDNKNSRQAIIIGELDLQYLVDAANALPALLDEVERLRGLADHTDDQIKLTGMRAELNQLSLELDMARRDRDKAEADLAAALKRAEISEKALHEISTAFNSHWTDALNMQRIAKEALAAIAGVAKGGEG